LKRDDHAQYLSAPPEFPWNFQKFDETAEKRDETAAGAENGSSHGGTKAGCGKAAVTGKM